jgi:hypothetical protein
MLPVAATPPLGALLLADFEHRIATYTRTAFVTAKAPR